MPVHGVSDFLCCPSSAATNAGEAWTSQFPHMSLTLFVNKMSGLNWISDFLSSPDFSRITCKTYSVNTSGIRNQDITLSSRWLIEHILTEEI